MTTTDPRLNMPLADALYSLRAIRRVKPDPIPDADLQVILDAAIQAPNGGNAQPWRFLVLKDAALRAEFAKLYREAWWAKRKDAGINGPQDIPKHDKVAQAAMRLADEFGNAPVVVLICATARGVGAMGSVIPSAQNLLLAARALGIGGTITTLHAVVEDRVHQLLGIPSTAQVVYALPLGYPKGRFGGVNRRPLADVAAVDGWNGPSL